MPGVANWAVKPAEGYTSLGINAISVRETTFSYQIFVTYPICLSIAHIGEKDRHAIHQLHPDSASRYNDRNYPEQSLLQTPAANQRDSRRRIDGDGA